MASEEKRPPVIDYEGSDYQSSFWEQGGREYEDRCEQIALRALLPDRGDLLLEIGAGAGRNTLRYQGFPRVALLDYSLTQLQQAQEYLGRDSRFIYVAGDVYRLPFVSHLFDGATMIRVLHHIQDPPAALEEIHRVLSGNSPFLLEFANKQNLKAIFRFWLGKQDWNPFSLEAVEFVELNFDFHPRQLRAWLAEAGFNLQNQRTVSHFRIGWLKKLVPASLLAFADGLVQPTGNLWQLSPSVFTRSLVEKSGSLDPTVGFFICPACKKELGLPDSDAASLDCGCGRSYPIRDGIYDFRDY